MVNPNSRRRLDGKQQSQPNRRHLCSRWDVRWTESIELALVWTLLFYVHLYKTMNILFTTHLNWRGFSNKKNFNCYTTTKISNALGSGQKQIFSHALGFLCLIIYVPKTLNTSTMGNPCTPRIDLRPHAFASSPSSIFGLRLF